jgi:(p)ppGpp synthase/HD superfamily hydrolase
VPTKWIQPAHTDWKVYNKAGKELSQILKNIDHLSDDEWSHLNTCLGIVANWRVAHRYPLHSIMMGVRQRARNIDANALVVQRLKRLPSIFPKIERGISLTQIQDIGGCRAVLADLPRLKKLHQQYSTQMDWLDLKSKSYLNGAPKNYIEHPKDDGYRSIHYVVRYVSDLEKYSVYDKMKIEVQIRTRAQHSWQLQSRSSTSSQEKD